MFTMNQVEMLTETAKFVFIFGFIFSMVQMFLNHSLKMKAHSIDDGKAAYTAIKKRFTIGLGLLCICFLAVLMVMNTMQNWYDDGRSNAVMVTSDPHLMKEAMNKIIDAIKLLVIFIFVSIGVRMVLGYREQVFMLKKNSQKSDDEQNKMIV